MKGVEEDSSAESGEYDCFCSLLSKNMLENGMAFAVWRSSRERIILGQSKVERHLNMKQSQKYVMSQI
jgi:hypothetical protein